MNARLHSYRNNYEAFTDPLWRDTVLTPLGQDQARALVGDARLAAAELIVCSPLTRALRTCELAYGGGPEGLPAGARVVAEPLAREKMWHSSDVGRPTRQLVEEYPFIDFSRLASDWWQWGADSGERRRRIDAYISGGDAVTCTPPEEPSEEFALRCLALIGFLEEQRAASIAVFCHWGVIAQLTGEDPRNCDVVTVGHARSCGASKLRSFYEEHVRGPGNSCEMWRRVLAGESRPKVS